MGGEIQPAIVIDFMRDLQARLCAHFEKIDGKAHFGSDTWEHVSGGGGCSRVMVDGDVFEKIGVNYSHIKGGNMPEAATDARPELAGRAFEATGVSIVSHPNNPHVPAAHCNVRFFATEDASDKVWWFGGGFDLTPYYPVKDDVVLWHKAARDLCAPFGNDVYPQFKAQCDDYFTLPHRGETRGVGGLFFEDLNHWGFDSCFAFIQKVAEGFAATYAQIIEKRRAEAYDDKQKAFQLIRRGRYVEFNLIYDRGTLFGLQSKGRTESVLMSLPPRADWAYASELDPDAEKELAAYLKPRPWLED